MNKLIAKITTIGLGIAMSVELGVASTSHSKTSVKAEPTEYSVSWDLTTASFSSATTSTVSWTSDYVNVYLYKNASSTNADTDLPPANAYTWFYYKQMLSINPNTGYEISRVVITGLENNDANILITSTWTNTTSETRDDNVATIIPDTASGSLTVTMNNKAKYTNITIYYLNCKDDSYNKITSTDDLYNEMLVVIGTPDYSALMTVDDTDCRWSVDAEQDGSFNAIKVKEGEDPDDVVEFFLGIEEMADGTIVYSFYDFDEDGYLYADGNDANEYLKTGALTNNARFTISITDGVATIEGQGTGVSNKYMCFDSGLFICSNTPTNSISLYAEHQNISDTQKVDTFVTKYMKMESISKDNTGTTANCASNWTAASAAYAKLSEDQQFDFVQESKYSDAAQRLYRWAEANGHVLDLDYGTLSTRGSLNIVSITSNNSSTTVIVVISVISVLTIMGYFLIRRRKEQ